MLYIRCPHCGKRMVRGEECSCNFKREYVAPTGSRKMYHTNRWVELRAAIMSKYNGLDQYALSLGKIEYADTVHHIKVASEYPELFYSPDNLIPVSRRNHDEIHMKYRAGGKTRAELEQYLKSLVSHDPLVVK